MRRSFDGGLTVLMPVYNCEKYVSQAVRSVLNQSLSNFEFLIIDDGSTDKSPEVVKSFNDERIRIIGKDHTGLADSLNMGLEFAKGEWIARIDADDIAVPKRLELQAEHIAKEPDTDVVAGYSVYFTGDNKIEFAVKPPVSNDEIRKMMDVHNPINHSTVTFRKRSVIDAGGYDAGFGCFEDFELWLRIRDKVTFSIIPENLAFTRLREGSMTSVAEAGKLYSLLNANLKSLREKGEEPEYLSECEFRIEYFYGSKDRVKEKKFRLNDPKMLAAYLSSLLPEKSFQRLKNLRLRYRLEMSRAERFRLQEELLHITAPNETSAE
ncbi:MAG: glycosyltransferase [Ignavibacteria bacterium]|nr:glycosyltransferase [Ignavibacteria bacterium]